MYENNKTVFFHLTSKSFSENECFLSLKKKANRFHLLFSEEIEAKKIERKRNPHWVNGK